ncbi:hypothetical protein BEWA_051590 [Theileria equi strain WA]|uniref:Uncharacterized protein n=1 Tax=Theileria equi strain WA TaxID=1537102 RepID=L1LCD6_THEEQ|nr:hypothetical protein BEWA_051590 [Theileria equi strain WA]EKX73107.1 hypothetical protein BEWA_051590 [Theileria equi strain WA]|eukprot:XP_004832559.1 hypothetical protein BEWA_051590 [Theileria equi strain WA]
MEDINETNGYSYYAQSYIIDYYSSLQDKGNSQHEDADSNNTGFLQTPDYSVLGFNPYSNNSWYGDHASREFAQTLQPPFEGIISMNNFSETGNNSFNYQHRDIYRGYNTHISFVDHMDIAANQYGYVQGQPVKQSHKDQSCFKPVFSKGSRKKGIRNVGL